MPDIDFKILVNKFDLKVIFLTEMCDAVELQSFTQMSC